MKKIYPTLLSFAMALCTSLLLICDRQLSLDSLKALFLSLNNNIILSTIVLVIAFLLYNKYNQKKYDKRIIKASIILSIFFSLAEIIGYYINSTYSFFNYQMNYPTIIYNLILFLGYVSIFYTLLCIILNYFVNEKKESLKRNHNISFFTNNRKSFFIVALFLIMCWLIYYFIFYSGVVTWDSYYQIEQAMGFKLLTNEHPFLHTLLQGFIIRLGTSLLGNINHGVAFCSFIQMSIMAFIISYVIKYLASKNIDIKKRLLILLFYALHPIIAIYSITLWKDVWMGIFNLTYIIILYEMFTDKENFFKSKKKVIILFINILLILFSKGTGIIIIIVSFIPIIFLLRKKLKIVLALLIISLLLFFGINSFAKYVFNVKSGHIREPFSIPIQQLSRTVKYHQNDLDKEDIHTLNEILPVDELASLYVPYLSDNTKGKLNEDNFSKNMFKYLVLWTKLGIKHPFTYVDSFLSNSYGYWYPDTIHWELTTDSYINMLNFYQENNWKIYDDNYINYSLNNKQETAKKIIVDFVNNYTRRIPIIGLFFSIGCYFWIHLICLTITILKRKYYLLPIHFTIIGTFIICVSSPVYAEFRYAYPAFVLLPIVLLFSLNKDKTYTIENY